MLSQLYIRDFAIVTQMELDLDSGFTVLTGETGAGKSILVDALALALGERADKGSVRSGCKRAEVSASFELPAEHEAIRWLRNNDLSDDGQCLLRRVVESEKSSKAYVNGRPVPIQIQKELGELLVDIHGQHEHQSLLKREQQRLMLDDYAALDDEVNRLKLLYQTSKELQNRLDTLKQQSRDRESRIELLQHEVKELDELGLGDSEMAQLGDEHARLANGASLIEGTQSLVHELYDNDELSVSHRLGVMISSLESLAEHDARLEQIADLLGEANIQVDEAANQLHQYVNNLDLDPQRLQWLDSRIAAIQHLSRKHRVKAEELPALLVKLKQELADIEDADTNLVKLESELTRAKEDYLKLASEVSKVRRSASKRLAEQVTENMRELGMPGGRFGVDFISLDEGSFGPYGMERIDFLVSANPDQPLKKLNKVASGGELSRVSLALQVVIADLGRIPTLIFDEVDVGIGGSVAEIVGGLLRTLGKSRQVLCITHLAQVAALGDQHLQVSKQLKDGRTNTDIRSLPEEERIQEIARMMGGLEISQQTLDHAQDMLERAS